MLKTLPLKDSGSAVPQALAATSSPTFAGVKLSAPGTGAGTAIVRDGSGNLLDLVSHRDAKEFIEPLQNVWSILDLQGCKFRYKGDLMDSFGFIADEVAAVNSQWVINVDGKPYSVPYHFFIPYIVECLKDLHAASATPKTESVIVKEVIPEVTKEDLTRIQVDLVTLSHSIDLVRDLHKSDHDAIISLKDKCQSVAKMCAELSDEVAEATTKEPAIVEFSAPEQKSILPFIGIVLGIVAIGLHWL